MPTVLLVDGFRFFFYSNENREPPQIHVEQAEHSAKFWLNPVELESSNGFNSSTLTRLQKLVIEKRQLFLEAWNEHFNS